MTETNNKVNSILIKVDSIEGKATTENNEEQKLLPPIQSDSYTPVEGKASNTCMRYQVPVLLRLHEHGCWPYNWVCDSAWYQTNDY